ncbi:MAG TPA: hypothetical protein PKV97_01880 [Thauera aminoaromatica]|nr:hypothetical protein [Thauera aminoaromatica]
MAVILRVGIPKPNGSMTRELHRRRQPVLISAGALWDPRTEAFRCSGLLLLRMDCALDSAGFVRGLSGYPWSVEQYVELAAGSSWAWWAQMDLPCEAAIAPDRETVVRRVIESAALFRRCAAAAETARQASAFLRETFADPMPVLQGRRLEDYQRSIELLSPLPALVGVGSMCTRPIHGPEGLVPIVEGLHQLLPASVQLHLFGVKGPALAALERFGDRILSVDSMAYDIHARKTAHREQVSNTVARRTSVMLDWISKQGPCQR